MTFSQTAIDMLKKDLEAFGTYTYHDKGPNEMMDVDDLVEQFKKLPKAECLPELHKLCDDTSTKIGNPTWLVGNIIDGTEDNPDFDFIYDDKDLMRKLNR